MNRNVIKYWAIFALILSPMAWSQAQPDMRASDKASDTRQRMLERASRFIGMNVYNNNNEKLGDIEDLVLNVNQNQINYAVLSYGGVVGIGDKLFAIPFTMLEQKTLPKDRLFLNVDKDRLAKAPGFNKKEWPDAANTAYWMQVDTYYRAPGEAVQARAEVAPNADTPKEKGIAWSRRTSNVIGANVKNPENESLGEINDLVLDAKTGKIQYAVLSFGGVMGIGDKLFAVPIGALRSATGAEHFVLNVSKDRLKTAPGFNQKQWPDFADQTWWNSVDVFYGQNATQVGPNR